MSKFRKPVNIFVLLVLVLTLILSGCGQAGNGEGTQAATSAEAATSAAVTTEETTELEPVKLSWYFPGNDQTDKDKVYAELNKLIKAKINAEVDFQLTDWNSYEEKMQLMSSAQEEYDLCYTASWCNGYWDNVNKGAFLPMDDLLDQYGTNLKQLIPAKYFDAARVRGKLYGIVSYQIIPRVQGFWIQKEMLDLAGVDASSLQKDWTVSDLRLLEPVLAAWKAKYPEKPPIKMGKGGFFGFLSNVVGMDEIAGPAVVMLDDPSGKVTCKYEDPDYLEFLKIMRDWFQKGYIPKDAATGPDEVGEETGKFGMCFVGNLKPGIESEMAHSYPTELVQISQPVLTTGAVCSSLNAISRTSKNPERAMMFLDLINSDKEAYNMLCYGLEGTHYTKIDDNTIELVENSPYRPNSDWIYGNQFSAYLKKGQDPNIWEDTKEINEVAIPSPVLGYVFNVEPVSNEMTAINSVIEEYVGALETGSVDPEKYLPEFMGKIKTAGLDTLLEEVQRQVDQWKKDNNK